MGLCIQDGIIQAKFFHGCAGQLTDLLVQIVLVTIAHSAVQQEDYGPDFLVCDVLIQGLKDGIQFSAAGDANHQLVFFCIVLSRHPAGYSLCQLRRLLIGLGCWCDGVQVVTGVLQGRLTAGGQRHDGSHQQNDSDKILLHDRILLSEK